MKILPNFLNKKISTPVGIGIVVVLGLIAGGVLFWQVKTKEIYFPPKISIERETKESTPAGPEIEIDVSDWRTYSSKKSGFQLEYPKNWEVSKNEDLEDKSKRGFEEDIRFASPETFTIGYPPDYEPEEMSNYMNIIVFQKDKWQKNREDGAKNPCDVWHECEKFTIGSNIPAYISQGATPVAQYAMIYTVKDRYLILIDIWSQGFPLEMESFRYMLSSFRFLD